MQFVVETEEDPPLTELSAPKLLMKDASDRDLVSLVLETIRNIVHYKDAFLRVSSTSSWTTSPSSSSTSGLTRAAPAHACRPVRGRLGRRG